MTCSVDGCGKPVKSRGWCAAHYYRWLRHGDTNYQSRAAIGDHLLYLNEVVLRYEGDECLVWPYLRGRTGYGQIKVDGTPRIVSRLVCEQAKGDEVLKIWGLKDKLPKPEIAGMFGVSRSAVNDIHRGKNWAWLTAAGEVRQ